MKLLSIDSSGITPIAQARRSDVREWQRWVPYAAVAWSLIYAGLGIYWAISGTGFPFTSDSALDPMDPLLGRFGSSVAWIVVIMAGLPSVAIGAAMQRGVKSRVLRPLFIFFGALLAGTLLLLMTSLDLLIKFGYIPNILFRLITGVEVGPYLESYQWSTAHQLLCLLGGFLWLIATISYARRSGDACLYCGRRDGPEGWTSPDQSARWSLIAVYVAMVAPVFYALTRFAWALGIPLGMTEEALHRGQEAGTWVSGLFLASFCLVGAAIMLGLVQRWGEVFPRWMVGLAGRRVPIALAVIPALLSSVLLTVGGIGIWLGLDQMISNAAAAGAQGIGLIGEITFQVGPTLLFPLWGVALAVATLGYYCRRRGPCSVCGRGRFGEIGKPSSSSW